MPWSVSLVTKKESFQQPKPQNSMLCLKTHVFSEFTVTRTNRKAAVPKMPRTYIRYAYRAPSFPRPKDSSKRTEPIIRSRAPGEAAKRKPASRRHGGGDEGVVRRAPQGGAPRPPQRLRPGLHPPVSHYPLPPPQSFELANPWQFQLLVCSKLAASANPAFLFVLNIFYFVMYHSFGSILLACIVLCVSRTKTGMSCWYFCSCKFISFCCLLFNRELAKQLGDRGDIVFEDFKDVIMKSKWVIFV